MGNVVTGNPTGGVWRTGSEVSILLNVEEQKAYLLNGNIPAITAEKIQEICI